MDSGWELTAERWLAADSAGHDVEAEAEFVRLVQALPPIAPSGPLEDRIWQATRWVRLRARAALQLRKAVAVAVILGLGAVALYTTTTTLLSLAARALVGLVAWLVRSCVWMVLALADGLDTWSFLTQIGVAMAEAIATPLVTTALILIQLLGGLAFYVLNRVLAREKETPQ